MVCYVKDVYGKTTIKVQSINVTDASAPILHIASPANNSIPNVKMSSDSKATVTIEGQTLDTSGCTYLEFLWVPNSFDKDNNKKQKKQMRYLIQFLLQNMHRNQEILQNSLY